jgi:hypothetical protein
LNSDSGDEITVEGCEDIDSNNGVTAESTQCKYFASRKYSLSGLREPLLPMLRSFAAGKTWKYTLYVHYPDSTGAPDRLTVNELKQSLTEQKRKPPSTVLHYKEYNDVVLQDFVDNFNLVIGPSFEQQQDNVHQALKAHVGGSIDDARYLHYGNSLACVMDLAMEPNQADRTITRSTFIERINKRPALFDQWNRELLGKEKFIRATQSRIKKAGLLAPTRRRLIVIDATGAASQNSVASKMFHIVETLATDLYGPGTLKSHKPWTILLEGDLEDVIEVKRQLATAGITFNDGYEDLEFNPTLFNADPIINTKGGSRKIEKTSYHIRLVRAQTYIKYGPSLNTPTSMVNFSNHPLSRYGDTGAVYVLGLQMINVEEILSFLKGTQ